MGLDQASGVVGLAGGQEVLDCFFGVAPGAEPFSCSLVQGPYAVAMGELHLTARHRTEQVVEAEPAVRPIEWDDEHVRALEVTETCCRVSGVGHVIAQGGAEPVQDRGRRDEVPHPVGLPTEYLFGEVVTDEAVAAAELPHEVVGVAPAGERQSGQVEAGRPALRAFHQLGDGRVR